MLALIEGSIIEKIFIWIESHKSFLLQISFFFNSNLPLRAKEKNDLLRNKPNLMEDPDLALCCIQRNNTITKNVKRKRFRKFSL